MISSFLNTHTSTIPISPIIQPTIKTALPALDDVGSCIFISGIPTGFKNDLLLDILNTCGQVRIWKRPVDTNGVEYSFGFCVYDSPASILRAMRVIEGEDERFLGGIELPTNDNNQPKRLRLNVEYAARQFALDYLKENNEKDDTSIDVQAFNKINEILDNLKTQKADEFLSSLDNNTTETVVQEKKTIFTAGPSTVASAPPPGVKEDDPLEDLPPEITPAQREIIRREIKMFRENTAEKDREKREREQQNVAEQKKRDEREYERDRLRRLKDAARKGNNIISSNGVDITPGSRIITKTLQEDEEEKKRRERRELELLQTFKEREQKWEKYELSRDKRLEADYKKPEEYQLRTASEKKKMLEYLQAYNDDDEQDTDEFFRDRERWISKRFRELMREKDFDLKDKQDEIREREEEALKLAEEKRQKPQIVGRIMTREERESAIKELVAKIPADREGIWNWNVKWEFCTESLIEGKLRPFLAKKFIEYIGAEERDLVDHTIRILSRKKGAQTVFNELSRALAEDAEIFVMKLWRMLIYETEARSKGFV